MEIFLFPMTPSSGPKSQLCFLLWPLLEITSDSRRRFFCLVHPKLQYRSVMATWEDQYLVYFPIVTGCGRVFKVPCSLTIMRQLLTGNQHYWLIAKLKKANNFLFLDETGDRMDVMIKNFFDNITMENPIEELLAMEFSKYTKRLLCFPKIHFK